MLINAGRHLTTSLHIQCGDVARLASQLYEYFRLLSTYFEVFRWRAWVRYGVFT